MKYMKELSEIGNIAKVPDVVYKIYDDCNELRVKYPNTYREFNYTIIDDQTFTCEHITTDKNINIDSVELKT